MTLLKREPRSVYRVYAEDEYLEGEHQPLELDGQSPASEAEASARASRGHLSPGAPLVVALIVTVALIVFTLVILAGGPGSHRRSAAVTAIAPAPRGEAVHRPAQSRSRPRHRRVRAHRRRRSQPLPRVVLLTLRPASAVAASAAWPRPDPQLEFGFER